MPLCFWCERETPRGRLTDDHVVPLGLGGADKTYNVVRACEPCNAERGKLVAKHCHLRELSRRTDGNRHGPIARARASLQQWIDLKAKWVEIERLRLGYSPSSAVDLEIADVPRVRGKKRTDKGWQNDLAEARRRAEANPPGAT